ncbi:MAG: hypothetical protein ACXWQQ_08740 [Pseudobdellovibrio sp.]
MKKTLLSTALLCLITQPVLANFNFASSVDGGQKKLIVNDLFYLANQTALTPDTKLQGLMGLQSNDGLTVLNWVANRVTQIVPENFDLKSNIYVANDSYFPEPSDLPVINMPTKTPDDGKNGSGPTVSTIMSNIGSGIYYAGKMQHAMLGLNIDGKKIDMTSPRMGILKVGAGLFQTDLIIKAPADSVLARVFRISTLVHEARHSDGRGASLGFLHTACPDGHRLAGYAACDLSSNGPYTVGAQFMAMMAQSCKECQPSDIEMINKMSADSFDRIVAPAPSSTDDNSVYTTIVSTYQMLVDMCKKTPGSCSDADLQKYNAAIADAQSHLNPSSPQQPAVAPKYDDTPEGTFATETRDQTWANIYQLNAQTK